MATPLTNAINALTTYANEVTGESDTNLSDAVYSLAEGYGQGGSNAQVTEADVTLESASEYLSFNCNHAPDIICVYAKNWAYASGGNGVYSMVIYKGHYLGYIRMENGALKYGITTGIVPNPNTYPYGNAESNGYAMGTYENGVFTIRARGASNSYKWRPSYTYHCVAITL